jgi:2-dehydro-3-deoxygluconokinase
MGASQSGEDRYVSRLLTLGETMAVAATQVGDPLRTARHLKLSIAGAEATVAIGVSRLGHEAAWVGVVGDDELGERVRRELAAEGVDVRFVRTCTSASTGFMIREPRTAEFTAVTYFRGNSAGSQLGPADVDAAFAAGADHVHVTGITPALSHECLNAVRRAVSLARDAGIPVSFDVNDRASLPGSKAAREVARELLSSVDVLFVGEDELWVVSDEPDPVSAARQLLDCGPVEVVVKRGAEGAVVFSPHSEPVAQAALTVRIADVVGAGDSFTAGYLAARMDGASVNDRLRWAVTCAACTVGTNGDWEGLPSRSDIENRSTSGQVTVR